MKVIGIKKPSYTQLVKQGLILSEKPENQTYGSSTITHSYLLKQAYRSGESTLSCTNITSVTCTLCLNSSDHMFELIYDFINTAPT